MRDLKEELAFGEARSIRSGHWSVASSLSTSTVLREIPRESYRRGARGVCKDLETFRAAKTGP